MHCFYKVIVGIAIFVAFYGVQELLAEVGTQVSMQIRHSTAYGTDDSWWKCNLDYKKGCDSGPLDQLGLTMEEQTYVNEILDRIPRYPQKVTTTDISRILKDAKYKMYHSMQDFENIGPGTDPNRGVSVLHYKGYISIIRWALPGRFLLIKKHTEPD